MAKFLLDEVLDQSLQEIALGDLLTVCATQPTTRTEAVTTFALADVALTPGDGNGDFTIANGDTNGRKVTVTAKNSIPVDTSGNADHAAITDATRLLLVTTAASTVAITSGGTVSTSAFKVETSDPS